MAEIDYSYIAQLVEKARCGDSNAFAELYAATYKKQYIFAVNYMKDENLAQDAVQETYCTAFSKLDMLKDDKLFISWLNQINFRVCFNMYNKEKQFNSMHVAYDEGIGELENDYQPSPESQVVKIDEKEYILQQIMELPYSESQTIFLHYYRGMTLKDIAYMLEMSKSSVKRYLKSGKKRLESKITGWDNLDKHGLATKTS